MSSSEKTPVPPQGEQLQQQQGGLLPLAPVEEDCPPRPPRPPKDDQHSTPPPASEKQQYYPPPPPGPPPQHQHQEDQSELPPSYEQGNYVPPNSEKQRAPAAQPLSGDEKQTFPPSTQQEPGHQGEQKASGASEKEKQEFPPPPPGPPPALDPHPNPLNAHPVDPVQPTQATYIIPEYNPAAPNFAPPPAQQEPEAQFTPSQNVPAPASSTNTPAEQPHKKVGWSERFSNLSVSLSTKAAAPINSLAHKLGSQSFLPETLDKECEKASSIIRTFCRKGVYADTGSEQLPTSTDPRANKANDAVIDPAKNKPKDRVLVTIPPKVISKAVGLAIFTTLRAGFNVSGALGSGILIARLADGSWGPPSAIQVLSVGGGFSIGLDIYDCVCVINSREALAAFTKTRVGLGTDLAVVAGPYGAGGAVEFGAPVENREGRKSKEKDAATPETADQTLKPEADKSQRRSLSASSLKPVFSYVKSRGFYAGIQIDGTVVVERKDANTAFYGDRVPVERILKGEVPPQGPSGMWPTGARGLLETLKGAEAGMLKEKEKDGDREQGAPVAGPSTGGSDGAEKPPTYVEDGIQRPGAGDHKYR